MPFQRLFRLLGPLAPALLSPALASAQFGLPVPISAREMIGESLRLVDVNGDALPDLIYHGASISWAQRTGPESFAQPEPLVAGLPQVGDLEVMDPDLDGDHDLVFVTALGGLFMIRQEANGVVGFATPLSVSTLTRPITLRVGDANGDGIEDLFISTAGGGVAGALTVELFLGDGAGSFARGATVRVAGNSSIADVAAADMNGDGLDDVVMSAGFEVQVAYSDPSGLLDPTVVATFPDGAGRIAAGDWDADGSIDLAVVQLGVSEMAVLRNDGALGFTQTGALPSIAGFILQLQAADLDADGDLDLAISGSGDVGFYENTGLGSFSSAIEDTIEPAIGSVEVLLADLDGDGPLDVIAPFSGSSRWSWARFQSFSSQPILEPLQPLWAANTSFVALATSDLDGDGRSEVLAASAVPTPKVVAFDDLDQVPLTPTLISEDLPPLRRMRTGDIDGDGTVDLVGQAFIGEILWLPDAGGPLPQAPTLITSSSYPRRIEVVDLDADGASEIVIAGSETEVEIYALDANGSFSAPVTVAQTGSLITNIRIADVDGDDAPDLLIASRSTFQFSGPGEVVWLKNTAGSFGPPVVLASSNAIDVHTADIDVDGIQDVVWLGLTPSSGLRWIRGTGGGAFEASALLASYSSGSRLEVTDADLDGDDDVVTTDNLGFMSWWRNSGGAVEQLAGPSIERVQDFAFGDVDADGDQDLAIIRNDNSGTFWIPNFSASPLGTAVCPGAVPHVGGESGTISATGSDMISANTLILQASSLPQLTTTLFLASTSTSITFPVSGSVGRLCLGSPIGRYVGPGEIQSSGFERQAVLTLNLQAMPTPQGLRPAAAGETWYFQAWFRDSLSGTPTSNFTDALAITLH